MNENNTGVDSRFGTANSLHTQVVIRPDIQFTVTGTYLRPVEGTSLVQHYLQLQCQAKDQFGNMRIVSIDIPASFVEVVDRSEPLQPLTFSEFMQWREDARNDLINAGRVVVYADDVQLQLVAIKSYDAMDGDWWGVYKQDGKEWQGAFKAEMRVEILPPSKGEIYE